MGYKFQFITLAGFHSLNLSMFDLARNYRDAGMTAYAKLQQEEFRLQDEAGYRAVRHQRFVGTGYFDEVTQVIAGGKSAKTALSGSTEEEQFSGAAPVGPSAANSSTARTSISELAPTHSKAAPPA
jgi:isocitrate lyase